MTLGDPAADVPNVVGGSPTDDESAAVAAVFTTLAAERAAASRRVPPTPRVSAWGRRVDRLRDPRPRDAYWSDRST